VLSAISTGGGGAHGKYYFEVTMTRAPTQGSVEVCLGVCSATYPLYNTVDTSVNIAQGPQGLVWCIGTAAGNAFGSPTQPEGGGAATKGDVLAIAIDTTAKKVWFKDITAAGKWWGAGSGGAGGDPVAGTFGATYGVGGTSPITGSVYIVCGSAGGQYGTGFVPTPPTAVPTLGSAVSGALAATTYYVRTAYVATATNNRSFPSPRASRAVLINNVLTVTSPPAQTSCDRYDVYASSSVGDSFNETLQATVTLGNTWQEPDAGLVAGVDLPMPIATLNTGGSAFTGTLPTGYIAWDAAETLNPSDNSNLTLDTGNLRFYPLAAILGQNGPANMVRSVGKKAS